MKILKDMALNLLIGALIVFFFIHPALVLIALGCPGTFTQLWTCGAFCETILFAIIATIYGLGKAARETFFEVNAIEKKGKKK